MVVVLEVLGLDLDPVTGTEAHTIKYPTVDPDIIKKLLQLTDVGAGEVFH